MFELLVVHSEDPSTTDAVEELIESARGRAHGAAVRGGVLFAGIDHDHARAVDAIVDAFPGIALIGCTTDGELSSEAGFCEDSLLLLLFLGDEISIRAGLGRGVGADPASAARDAVVAACAGLDGEPRLCLTTPESLTCDAAALITHLRGTLGDRVPVIGGTAGDHWRFRRSLQFCGREVVSDAVPVLLIAGDLLLSHGVASGWTPVGSASVATEVAGNVLHRIGEQTAIDFYQHFLGTHLVPSGEYPLAVFIEDGRHYLRAPVGHDLEKGSITFAGTIPAGARVQITAATRDAIIQATQLSVTRALDGYPGEQPAGALIVSCAARKQLLGTRTAEECALLKRSALGGLPFCGFYAYGELSPVRDGDVTHFHNETFVTLLLGTR